MVQIAVKFYQGEANNASQQHLFNSYDVLFSVSASQSEYSCYPMCIEINTLGRHAGVGTGPFINRIRSPDPVMQQKQWHFDELCANIKPLGILKSFREHYAGKALDFIIRMEGSWWHKVSLINIGGVNSRKVIASQRDIKKKTADISWSCFSSLKHRKNTYTRKRSF